MSEVKHYCICNILKPIESTLCHMCQSQEHSCFKKYRKGKKMPVKLLYA